LTYIDIVVLHFHGTKKTLNKETQLLISLNQQYPTVRPRNSTENAAFRSAVFHCKLLGCTTLLAVQLLHYPLGVDPGDLDVSRWFFSIKTCVSSSRNNMTVCQNLVPLVNIKIAGKWMFIPLKMVLIDFDPPPYKDIKGCSKKLGARNGSLVADFTSD